MNATMLFFSKCGFALLTAVFAFLLINEIKAGIERTNRPDLAKKKMITRFVVVLIGWLVFVGVWSITGIMSKFEIFPLNFMPVLILPLITVIVLMFSNSVNEILINIPAEHLIRLQVFRVFVEVLLWMLFLSSALPVQMTFEGMNFDVLSGLTAPVIAWMASRKKISANGLIVWNLFCLALLINIVSIAILSMPTPLRSFMNEPANTIVADFPVSWLPGFLVPLAYTLNLFSLKQAILKKRAGVIAIA